MTQDEMQKQLLDAVTSGKMPTAQIVMGDMVGKKIIVEAGGIGEQNNYYGSDGSLLRQENDDDDEDEDGSPKTIEDRILAVFNSNLCKHDADWGVVFKLLIENKKFGFSPTEYDRCAELINTTCKETITNGDSIRLSKANTSLGGTYETGWRDTNPTKQTKSMLKRYNAIAAVFMLD